MPPQRKYSNRDEAYKAQIKRQTINQRKKRTPKTAIKKLTDALDILADSPLELVDFKEEVLRLLNSSHVNWPTDQPNQDLY